jgi:hypothetical protein
VGTAIQIASNDTTAQLFFRDQVINLLQYSKKIATSQERYVQVNFNNTVTPNQFEFSTCSGLTTTAPISPISCQRLNVLADDAALVDPSILTVPSTCTVTVNPNSGSLYFDFNGQAFDINGTLTNMSYQISTYQIEIVASTGFIHAR